MIAGEYCSSRRLHVCWSVNAEGGVSNISLAGLRGAQVSEVTALTQIRTQPTMGIRNLTQDTLIQT